MMELTFDIAFDRLIGHEGGYVEVQYVDEHETQNHSRIGARNGGGLGCRSARPYAIRSDHLHRTDQLARVWLSSTRLCKTGIRKGALQRTLHKGSQRIVAGSPCASKEEGRRLRRMRQENGGKGWMGLVPAALSTGALRDTEGCCGCSIRSTVRALRRFVSSLSFRFSSQERQGWLAKRDVLEQIHQRACSGIGEVHSAVCQLSQIGAPR